MRKLTLLILLIFGICQGEQILAVPFIKQKDEFCGPAALSSVLAFYGEDVSQEEVAENVYIKQLKGALITDLENYAKSKGYKTLLKSSNIEEIKKIIKEGKPVIALIDLGFWIMSVPHYIVIIGYNQDGIIAHTGYEEKKLLTYGEFEKKWQKLGNTILLIYK